MLIELDPATIGPYYNWLMWPMTHAIACVESLAAHNLLFHCVCTKDVVSEALLGSQTKARVTAKGATTSLF